MLLHRFPLLLAKAKCGCDVTRQFEPYRDDTGAVCVGASYVNSLYSNIPPTAIGMLQNSPVNKPMETHKLQAPTRPSDRLNTADTIRQGTMQSNAQTYW
jgi:hypothetical protein